MRTFRKASARIPLGAGLGLDLWSGLERLWLAGTHWDVSSKLRHAAALGAAWRCAEHLSSSRLPGWVHPNINLDDPEDDVELEILVGPYKQQVRPLAPQWTGGDPTFSLP